MAKKVVSLLSVHKNMLTKPDKSKKKKVLLKKVLDFLKSDTYMFASLASPQASDDHGSSPPSLCIISTGVEANEPFKEPSKKLFAKVKNYMNSDCYMHAPLVIHQPWLCSAAYCVNPRTGPVSCSETADTGTKEDSMKNVTDETRDLRQKIKNINIRDQLLGGHPHARSPIFKHTIVQQETVKRVVQQNCRSSAVPGDVERQKKGGKEANTERSITHNSKKKRKRIA